MPKANKEASDLIAALSRNRFYAECPCGCGETFLLRDAGLFHKENFTEQAREILDERLLAVREGKIELKELRATMAERLEKLRRPVQQGKISEKIAPCLPGFCYNHSDCRPLYDPIDYLIFEGVSMGRVTRLIFTDVKTGAARLTARQKRIKELVESKKVRFDTYQGAK